MRSRPDPSAERLQSLLGSTDQIVFEFDADGTYLNIWTANDELLVLPREEMLGRTIGEIFGEQHMQGFLQSMAEVLATAQPCTLDMSVDLPIGPRWFRYRFFRIPGADGRTPTVGVLARDVTEGVLSERALRESVILVADPGHFAIRVEDDGVGWARRGQAEPTNAAIRSMRQRVELAHGEFRILPRSPRGTIVSFRLPIG